MIDFDLEILYEDEDIIAINKPAGVVVHPDGKSLNNTLTDKLLEKYPKIKDVGEPLKLQDGRLIKRPGIVHRLDKDTSGVMLVAKTQVGFTHLKAQFKKREILKVYNAFVYGNLKIDKKTIDWPIGRSKGDIRRWTVKKFARGKIREAVTEIKVLNRAVVFENPTNEKSHHEHVSFVEARPMTGRTHQIRVHMKAIYHPLICDELYAPGRAKLLGFERLALHAREIVFQNRQGESVDITAPYPEDFQDAVDRVCRMWNVECRM
ncbi:RluA family pseudouridine synthase [Candidatus Nomurabacteria bacterium]|nr:RluA family pseudouridine synthase [Candidatus Nomurabacteria bacterium]